MKCKQADDVGGWAGGKSRNRVRWQQKQNWKQRRHAKIEKGRGLKPGGYIDGKCFTIKACGVWCRPYP